MNPFKKQIQESFIAFIFIMCEKFDVVYCFFLQESKFRETGVLTPEEFVAAGDHLVHHCPTWQWAAGDDNKTKSYLPKGNHLIEEIHLIMIN